jgi:hypothetical protein
VEEREGTGRSVSAEEVTHLERAERLERRRFLTAGATGVLFVGLYAFRPDWATALWYWPPWLWACIFISFALPSLAFRRFKFALFTSVLWIAFALAFDDTLRGIARSVLPRGEATKGLLTVVSFNCAGGSVAAAKEAIGTGASLVLLQESPSGAEINKLARARWGESGSVVRGPDCSILAEGELENFGLVGLTAPRSNFIWAIWTRPNGERFFVVSLRLSPPVFRLDYWTLDCWKAYVDDRRRRTEELDEIVTTIRDLAPGVPVIVGGDFNGTPTEDFQGSLRRLCRDSYVEAGRGWGGTGTNDFPFVRFDQIWANPALRPVETVSRRSLHSDHRMVRATFAAAEPSAR